MQQLITSLLSDGQGSTSMMRLIVLLIVVTVIGTKFYNAYLTHTPIVWDTNDLLMLGGAITGKLVQNTQENNGTKST